MALTRLSGANAITGTIPIANGGTGVTTAADLANTGNLVKIAGTSFTGLSAITLDNFTTDYTKYLFLLNFDFGSVTNVRIKLKFRSSSTTLESGYDSNCTYINAGLNNGSIQDTSSDSQIEPTGDLDTMGTGKIWFFTPAQSDYRTHVMSRFVNEDSGSTQVNEGFGSRGTEEANDGFHLYATSGTFSGNYNLFAYKD